MKRGRDSVAAVRVRTELTLAAGFALEAADPRESPPVEVAMEDRVQQFYPDGVIPEKMRTDSSQIRIGRVDVLPSVSA